MRESDEQVAALTAGINAVKFLRTSTEEQAQSGLGALRDAGWEIVRVGEIPPWMEETNARQNAAGSCIGGMADWSGYPDFDVKLYRIKGEGRDS